MTTFTSTIGLIFITLFIIAVARAAVAAGQAQEGRPYRAEDLGTSMAIAAMTGSAALGYAAGGSFSGAMVGESMSADEADW